MNYEIMMYVYRWMIEEHHPIGIDHQQIRDEDYIKDSMRQHYIEFDEDQQDESRF